jgi:hypothetical protein
MDHASNKQSHEQANFYQQIYWILPKDRKADLFKKQVEPGEVVVSIVRAAVSALALGEGYPEA